MIFWTLFILITLYAISMVARRWLADRAERMRPPMIVTPRLRVDVPTVFRRNHQRR